MKFGMHERKIDMNILDRLREGAQVISEKSGELLELANIKAAISKTETEMVKKYTELGEITYHIYNHEDVENGAIEGLCLEIRNLDRELQNYRQQLSRGE